MKILLDTNFLIYIIKHRIVDELKGLKPELIVPMQVFNEIKKINNKSMGKNKEYSGLALNLIENWKKEGILSIANSEKKYADEALFQIAIKDRIITATLDKLLIQKLKKAKIGILKIRQKKYLMFD